MQKNRCVAIVGSRSLHIDVRNFVPQDIQSIVTGGAQGVDSSAIAFARQSGIPITVICPDYDKLDKLAPIIRNRKIVSICDSLIAIWDGKSSGTKNAILLSVKSKKPTTIFIVKKDGTIKETYNMLEQIRFI